MCIFSTFVGMIKLQLNFLHIRLDLTRQRRRLTWQATPSSNCEVVSSAVMKNDDLSIDNDTARLFIDNDHLVFRVTISVVSDWCILEFITPSNTEGTVYHYTLLRANYMLWSSYILIEDNMATDTRTKPPALTLHTRESGQLEFGVKDLYSYCRWPIVERIT